MPNASSNHPAGDGRGVLTDRQGHPVHANQNLRTIGDRGPATLENHQFLEKMAHLYLREGELGARVGDGLGISADDVRGLPPLATQTVTDAELDRARNVGGNPPREANGNVMTHCVPSERVAIAADGEFAGASGS